MNSVGRNSKWGKTIYLMMLLACVYGLRVSDIRGLRCESIRWDEKTISLFQKKTRVYIELPLTEEAKFALLDYMKNVRPDSDDPHVFIRHLHPHIPYSEQCNFSGKLDEYFKLAGVNTDGKHHGLHSMRFSLATGLLSDETPIDEIAAILGHKKIESTKGYAWADMKHLKSAALEVPQYVTR
jgi:integrase